MQKSVTKITKKVIHFVNTIKIRSSRPKKNPGTKAPGRAFLINDPSLVIKLLRLVNGLAGDLDSELVEHVEINRRKHRR